MLNSSMEIPTGMNCRQCGTDHNEQITKCPKCGVWFCDDCFKNHVDKIVQECGKE